MRVLSLDFMEYREKFFYLFKKIINKLRYYYHKIYDCLYKNKLIKRSENLKKQNKNYGINNSQIILSLTTTQSRLPYIHWCLESLLNQNLKPDKIILWLADGTEIKGINYQIISNQVKRGIEIRYCKDIGSYKKYYFAFEEFPDKLIVTADDDFLYPRKWLSSLFSSYQKSPENVHCHRAHYITKSEDGKILPYLSWNWLAPGIVGPSSRLFLTTGGGAIFNPKKLSKEVLNYEVFSKLCPTADDVWINAMLLLSGIQCQKVKKNMMHLSDIIEMQDESRLSLRNVEGGGNDEQFNTVMNYYDIWSKLN